MRHAFTLKNRRIARLCAVVLAVCVFSCASTDDSEVGVVDAVEFANEPDAAEGSATVSTDGAMTAERPEPLEAKEACRIVDDRCESVDPSTKCCNIRGARYRAVEMCIEGSLLARAANLIACSTGGYSSLADGADCDGAAAPSCVQRAAPDGGMEFFELPVIPSLPPELSFCDEMMESVVFSAPPCSP